MTVGKKLFITFFILAILADQFVKWLFLEGFRFKSEYFDLILVYNKGVAFSMLSFLDGYLKYLQLGLIILLLAYLLYQKSFLKAYPAELGTLLGAGLSNLADRFMRVGVVDFFYWHKFFTFAVFNLADVLINISVASILLREFLKGRKNARDIDK